MSNRIVITQEERQLVGISLSDATASLFNVDMDWLGEAETGGKIGYWTPSENCNIAGIEFYARQPDESENTVIDIYIGDSAQGETLTLPAGENYTKTALSIPLNVTSDDLITVRFTSVGATPAAYLHARLRCRTGAASESASPEPDGAMVDRDGNFILDRDGNYILTR